MAGTLYLCATPIGNLEDMTYRAVRILKEVDLIAAEDTRNSIKLLNHFEIKTKMTSYHEYNKVDKAVYLVNKLKEGLNIAVITDAGTPGISDPGEELVRQCYEAGITVTSLPGACACIQRLPCQVSQQEDSHSKHFYRMTRRKEHRFWRIFAMRQERLLFTKRRII